MPKGKLENVKTQKKEPREDLKGKQRKGITVAKLTNSQTATSARYLLDKKEIRREPEKDAETQETPEDMDKLDSPWGERGPGKLQKRTFASLN